MFLSDVYLLWLVFAIHLQAFAYLCIFPSDNTANKLHEGIVHRVGNGLGECEGKHSSSLYTDNLNIKYKVVMLLHLRHETFCECDIVSNVNVMQFSKIV